jgi:hypothetical protein
MSGKFYLEGEELCFLGYNAVQAIRPCKKFLLPAPCFSFHAWLVLEP